MNVYVRVLTPTEGTTYEEEQKKDKQVERDLSPKEEEKEQGGKEGWSKVRG